MTKDQRDKDKNQLKGKNMVILRTSWDGNAVNGDGKLCIQQEREVDVDKCTVFILGKEP